MGILLSAMAAAGDAGVQSMNQNIDQQNRLDLNQQTSALEQQKAQALIDYKLNAESTNVDDQREDQADRINDAQQSILQSIIARKANANTDYDNGDGTSSPASYDELPDEDQTNPDYQPTGKETRDAYLAAAQSTGDIDPKTVATLAGRDDIAQMRSESYANRSDTMVALAGQKADSAKEIAQLRIDAANERAINGKIDTATGRSLIASEDSNMHTTAMQLSALNKQLTDLPVGSKRPEVQKARDNIMQQIQEFQQEIQASKATKNAYLKQMGFPTSDDIPKASAPSAASPSAAAQGGYVVGKQYRDAKGNTATYAGNGQWNP